MFWKNFVFLIDGKTMNPDHRIEDGCSHDEDVRGPPPYNSHRCKIPKEVATDWPVNMCCVLRVCFLTASHL